MSASWSPTSRGSLNWQPNTAPTIPPRSPFPRSTTDRTPRMAAKVADLQTVLAKPAVLLLVDRRRARPLSYDRSGDILSYMPDRNFPSGHHAVRVVTHDDDGLVGREEWIFRVFQP